MNSLTEEILNYIDYSKTAFHAVELASRLLDEAGFTRVDEGTPSASERYYSVRNMSSLIAVRKGGPGLMLTASHCDSPSFKLKESCEIASSEMTVLNTEKYGGMIMSSWMDRPLGIAGRAVLSSGSDIRQALFKLDNVAVIPSLAIHFNRGVNSGYEYNAQKDMLPLFAADGKSIKELIAESCSAKENEKLLGVDAFLYNAEKPVLLGNSLYSAPRIDDLASAFTALKAFTEAKPSHSANVFCLFDNEEVGSGTMQGADSDFLSNMLAFADEKALNSAMLLSIDNAHAFHPNYPEKYDAANRVYLNGGIAVKHTANAKYTTDALSSAVFREIAERAGARVQHFHNRSDVAGGSTLGNIALSHKSLLSADIGLPQLAMHSALETAGLKDIEDMYKAVKLFYEASLSRSGDRITIL